MKVPPFLIVVPARGGSKGIKLKNIATVGGKTLIELVAEVIHSLPVDNRAIVSTDNHDIAREARRVGLAVPFIRPENISGDRVSDAEVLLHALAEMERIDATKYQVIVMLQPTSPFRTVDHVVAAINQLGNYDSVLTLSETDSKAHPLKQFKYDGFNVKYYDQEGASIIARQQLEALYHRNGVAYVVTRECLTMQRTVIGKNCTAILIQDPMISIDTSWDLDMANWILETKHNN